MECTAFVCTCSIADTARAQYFHQGVVWHYLLVRKRECVSPFLLRASWLGVITFFELQACELVCVFMMHTSLFPTPFSSHPLHTVILDHHSLVGCIFLCIPSSSLSFLVPLSTSLPSPPSHYPPSSLPHLLLTLQSVTHFMACSVVFCSLELCSITTKP